MTHSAIEAASVKVAAGAPRRSLPLGLARIALACTACVSVYLLYHLPPPWSRYGAPARGAWSTLAGLVVIALSLQWGIGRRRYLARWGAIGLGALAAVFAVVRVVLVIQAWRQQPPTSPVVVLSFELTLLALLGFVAAGVCCAVVRNAESDWH